MRRLSVVLLAMGCLAACGSKPAPPPVASKVAGPALAAKAAPHKLARPAGKAEGTRYSGTVGQLDDSGDFVEFINQHENQAVTLDLFLPSAGFDGGKDGGLEWFAIWDDCDELPEGQKPGGSLCTGYEYTIGKAANGEPQIVQDGDYWRVRGRFRVVNAGGPLQGLMSMQLVPLPKDPGGAE
ncbi:MAG TPA: hypothetical protein VN776_15760 [Terracidiphilus sp.]|nr:hypothetical protein [Terracidiphilus sp.]